MPSSGDYPVFIISASTSGGLAKDIVKESNGAISQGSISTLLGAYEENYPRLLYVLPKDERGVNLSSTDTLRRISVSGEDFIFRPGEPKAIVLKRSQLPDKFSEVFSRFQGKNLLRFYKRFNAERLPKAILVDGTSLVKDNEFREWLVEKAKGALPASVQRIVYQEDSASKIMALTIQEALTPFYGNSPPSITSTSELEALPPNKNETVAVAAAVIGSGMELMRVTRALRAYQPEGSRYFIIGAIVSRTYAQLTQLKSNLRLRDNNKLNYAVETWGEFAPGTESIIKQRTRELRWLDQTRDIAGENTEVLEFLDYWRDALGDGGIIHSGAADRCPFISLSKNNSSAFDVGKGFALWNRGFKNGRCPVDVLFTIACWLQNARESTTIPLTDRLEDGGFQQTVIAPDCFLRFTDPVIQVAILKCARDSELDYRASTDLSARAGEIIAKFARLQEPSFLEFLAAIALERMHLLDSDVNRIIDECKKAFPTDPKIKLLVDEISSKQLRS